jgi:hypothetical protein
MDLSSQVKKIFSAETSLLSIHYWLEGMDIINNDASLDSGLVNQYIEYVTQNTKPFTPLYNYSSLKRNFDALNGQKMRIIYLPVNDDSHLMFSLITEDFLEKLVYTECTDYCKVLAPYRFPDIELRRSIDFSKEQEIMDSISKGMFFYDPIIAVSMMDPDMIIESYNAMKNFIEYAKSINH